jgi:hypothetical protein
VRIARDLLLRAMAAVRYRSSHRHPRPQRLSYSGFCCFPRTRSSGVIHGEDGSSRNNANSHTIPSAARDIRGSENGRESRNEDPGTPRAGWTIWTTRVVQWSAVQHNKRNPLPHLRKERGHAWTRARTHVDQPWTTAPHGKRTENFRKLDSRRARFIVRHATCRIQIL